MTDDGILIICGGILALKSSTIYLKSIQKPSEIVPKSVQTRIFELFSYQETADIDFSSFFYFF